MIPGSNLSWPAASPRPLAGFRIGLAGVLLVQAMFLVGHLGDLYGRHGIVDWSVTAAGRSAWIPDVSWLDRPLALAGVPAAAGVPLTFAAYVVGLVGLLVGYRTRLAAVVAWLTHLALITSGSTSCYGVDHFAHIGLFYCVWFPVGHALSLDRSSGRVAGGPTYEAWLSLLVLRLHVCVIYTFSGVAKMLGEQWWNGEAIWRAVMAAYQDGLIDGSFLAAVPWLAMALGWGTLLLEAGVVAFVWHPVLRRVWLVGIVGMHLGIAVVLGLWTFAGVMIVFDLAAFGIPARAADPTVDCTMSPATEAASEARPDVASTAGAR